MNQTRRIVMFYVFLVILLVVGPSFQQSYIESITVSQSPTGCQVKMEETYTFFVTSGSITIINFPIYRDALYTNSPIITSVSVTSIQAPVLEVQTSTSSITVYTNTIGRSTFTLSYYINGYLESSNKWSTLRWGTEWSIPIQLITITQTLPSSPSSFYPSQYVTNASGLVVTYAISNLPVSTPFLVQTTMNSYSVSGCGTTNSIFSNLTWVVVFPLLIVGVCVVLVVIMLICCYVRIGMRRRHRFRPQHGRVISTEIPMAASLAPTGQYSNQVITTQIPQLYPQHIQQSYPQQMQQPPQQYYSSQQQQPTYPQQQQQQQYYSSDRQQYYSPEQQNVPQSFAPEQQPTVPQPYASQSFQQPHIYQPATLESNEFHNHWQQ